MEVDGELHSYQASYDAERDQVFAAAGVCVFRVQNQDVRERMDWVLEQIGGICARELEA